MEGALKLQLKLCVAEYQELCKQLDKLRKQLLLTDFITANKPIDVANNEDNSALEPNSCVTHIF